MSIMCKTEQLLDEVTRSLETWKKIIKDGCDSNENEFNVLKKHVEVFCKLEQQHEKINKALLLVDEKLNSSIKFENVNELYQDCYESLPTSSAINYLESKIWQAVYKGNPDVCEVYTERENFDHSKFEEVDESLLCSSVFSPPIDPITKIVIKNPCKSKRCGHTYEYQTIVDYIKQTKHKAKCPYIGCNNSVLKMTDIVQDEMLKSQISQYNEAGTSKNAS